MSRHHQGRFAGLDGTRRVGAAGRNRLIVESTPWFVDQKQRGTSSERPRKRQAPLPPV
jgi:hypothetical protein